MTAPAAPDPATLAPAGERLTAAAERFLATGALDRSVPLRRLFDFLLECTLKGRMPREIDVAQDVFGRTSGIELAQDATIRVQVHRLRKKLEEFRTAHPAEPSYLALPRGEYRLVVDDAANAAPADAPALAPSPASPAPVTHRRRWWLAALAAVLVLNIGGWLLVGQHAHFFSSARAAAREPFWSALGGAANPTVIVVGDYYIFGEAQSGLQVSRLVREFSINSRDDLDQYLMEHPDQMGRLIDLNLHYLPVGAASALRSIMPVIEELKRGGKVRVITMSQLTPDILKGSNVIYVGFLSGLGLLRDIVFDASSLKVGESYDELIDTRTGKHYTSDWSEVADGRTPQRDFGYLANIALPGGKRLVVIAGTRDAALMQSADSAADADQLREIAKRTQGAGAAEALIEVNTMGDAALAGKLVLARPIRGPVNPAAHPNHQVFPDEMSGGH